MTVEAARKTFDELKAQGASDKDIGGALFLMFQNGEIDHDQFGILANILGFELSPEFESMSPEEQKINGFRKVDSEREKAMKLFGN